MIAPFCFTQVELKKKKIDCDLDYSTSGWIRFWKIMLPLDLHSVNMNGNFQDFWSNSTYFSKYQGECGKFTVLTYCRVNDMVNKIYFDFQTSCRKISYNCIDFACKMGSTDSEHVTSLYVGEKKWKKKKKKTPTYRNCTSLPDTTNWLHQQWCGQIS